jgi:hypothetical protein
MNQLNSISVAEVSLMLGQPLRDRATERQLPGTDQDRVKLGPTTGARLPLPPD